MDTAQSSELLSDNPLVNLIVSMLSVRTETEEAKLNMTTISDGKGGRIYL